MEYIANVQMYPVYILGDQDLFLCLMFYRVPVGLEALGSFSEF